MQQVVFRLLGPPEIFHKDRLIKIPRRRSRALLYYLVCTQSPQPRERLLTLLCGNANEESARHTFKTLLAEVRALLRSLDTGIEWIISDGDQIKLNPHAPLWLDTEIFEKVAAGTSHNLDHATDLYRGSFLDGFFLKDAPDFEDWMRSARDHFQRLYLTTLRRLAELYESENQLEQAITCTQMLLKTDPLVEEAYTYLMHLYWTTGDRVAAIRQYERLCTILTQELAVKPSASTQALYEQIAHRSTLFASGQPPTSHAPLLTQEEQLVQSSPLPALTPGQSPISAPLIDRAAEMEWLHQHLTGPINQYPLLLLQGEMGNEKTRLLYEMRKQIYPAWRILQGTCQEVEQMHPYHAVVEALRQGLTDEDLSQLDLPGIWLTQIAQLLPDLFHSSAFAQKYAVIVPLILADALVALLNKLAQPQRPVLLILHDLHWADTATLGLLGHLAYAVQRGRVFLLGTFCQDLAEARLEPLRRSAARQGILAELTISLPSVAENAQKQRH
ncbi:MAG: BTAD domain-containing putative transcriptional regulator [Ktedonobacteraceae bacterium]